MCLVDELILGVLVEMLVDHHHRRVLLLVMGDRVEGDGLGARRTVHLGHQFVTKEERKTGTVGFSFNFMCTALISIS